MRNLCRLLPPVTARAACWSNQTSTFSLEARLLLRRCLSALSAHDPTPEPQVQAAAQRPAVRSPPNPLRRSSPSLSQPFRVLLRPRRCAPTHIDARRGSACVPAPIFRPLTGDASPQARPIHPCQFTCLSLITHAAPQRGFEGARAIHDGLTPTLARWWSRHLPAFIVLCPG